MQIDASSKTDENPEEQKERNVEDMDLDSDGPEYVSASSS